MSNRLSAHEITLQYQDRAIVRDLSVPIPDGSFTAIIGPNACGKSTLLRALSRLLAPRAGRVILDGRDIATYPVRQVARTIGLLPQAPVAPDAPDGIKVADLVARGRFPHQGFLQQWSPDDGRAVNDAMIATGVADLADRPISELSGGQRQRVWIAMALAQETPIVLLDEPTTWLDLSHQIELLELLSYLNTNGRTIVAVLHELNLAFRYATHLVAMREGRIMAQGTPDAVVDEEMIRQVFGMQALVTPDPLSGRPMIIPRGKPYHPSHG